MPGGGALGGGDVVVSGQAGEVGGGVAQRGQDLRSAAGSDARGIFTLGDVTNVVDPVLDLPVPAQPDREQARVGGVVIQRGERVDGLDRPAPVEGGAPADDLDRPPGRGSSAAMPVPSRSTTLIERDSRRPWPRSRRREPGALAQGSRRSARRRVGWLAWTVNR